MSEDNIISFRPTVVSNENEPEPATQPPENEPVVCHDTIEMLEDALELAKSTYLELPIFLAWSEEDQSMIVKSVAQESLNIGDFYRLFGAMQSVMMSMQAEYVDIKSEE